MHLLIILIIATLVRAAPSVVLVGNLQTRLGCQKDWAPDCFQTRLVVDTSGDGLFKGSFKVPPGTFEFKVALGGSWIENYGLDGLLNGPNYKLKVDAWTLIQFVWDSNSRLLLWDYQSHLLSVIGNFQKAAGCSENHSVGCLRPLLLQVPRTSLYQSTIQLNPGVYYGQLVRNSNLVPNTAIEFIVKKNGVVDFVFDSAKSSLYVEIDGSSCNSSPGSADNCIATDSLLHDTRNLTFREPFGALKTDEPLVLRFQTRHDDVERVVVKFEFGDDWKDQSGFSAEMTKILEFSGFDLWEYTITLNRPGILSYYFVPIDGVVDGIVYGDDLEFDGGVGKWSRQVPLKPFTVTLVPSEFANRPIPEWSSNAIVYHIFPDRFRNGNKSNDVKTGGMSRYGWNGSGDTKQMPIQQQWNELPESHCRAYDPACHQPQNSINRDFFGGDLQGIIEKLDYLASLSVTVVYLNPIFLAPSNHLYDTIDYMKIAPWFGDLNVWTSLVRESAKRGMRLVLDGVFNHVSSDSPFFNQYGTFKEVGACQSVHSAFRDWFTFIEDPLHSGKAPCAGPNGPNTMYYENFLGFDTLPTLKKTNLQVQELVVRPSKYWLEQGAAGWRLDAMFSGTYDPKFWPNYRKKIVKDSVLLIGEAWGKEEALSLIYGTKADGLTNYRFRNALLLLLIPESESPSEFTSRITSIRQDYSDLTWFSNWNILDSHDSPRFLWEVTPGKSNRLHKEFNQTNASIGKQRLLIAMTIQYTMPGNPLIYYGNEVGLTGDNDPDNRRTFPWNDFKSSNTLDFGQGGDLRIYNHAVHLGKMRRQYSLFSKSSRPVFLVADDARKVLAYLVSDNKRTGLVVVNLNPNAQKVSINFPFGLVPLNSTWKNVSSPVKISIPNPDEMVSMWFDGESALNNSLSSNELLLEVDMQASASNVFILEQRYSRPASVTSSSTSTTCAIDHYRLYKSVIPNRYEFVKRIPATADAATGDASEKIIKVCSDGIASESINGEW